MAHTFGTNSKITSPVIKFNGSQWTSVASNYSAYGGTVHSFNNNLYCGGAMGVFSYTNGNLPSVLGNFVKLNWLYDISIGKNNCLKCRFVSNNLTFLLWKHYYIPLLH